MIVPNFDSLCRQAEPYYYFLFSESYELIPASILSHFEHCQHCQEQVNQLGYLLSQAKGFIDLEPGQVSGAIAIMMNLHFAHIDKPVTCRIVKPFLPSLLDPALEIRMPTPITAHIDNCRQCSEDLGTIRKLNLGRKQLRRLSQLLSERLGEDNVSCSKARAAIFAVVHMAFQETTEEVLKHLCTCPNCRKALYEFRDVMRKEYEEIQHGGIDQEVFPCEKVPITDIFDYVVPYGLDPAADQYAKFRKPLTSHMRACPTCLAKMQQLHTTVYRIAERPESDVVTIFHIDESAKAKAATESKDAYAGFPISVQITSREERVKAEQSASTVSFTAVLRQKMSAVNIERFAKTGVAAAAAILIAIALLLNIQPTKAVTIDKIYKAIEKANNVYIASFIPDKKEPIQELWVSRTLNIYMSRTGKELVLWDLANKAGKTKHLDADLVETTPLSNELIAEVEKMITGSLGLMPFDEVSNIPEDAEWSRVAEDEGETIDKSIEVYDLKWVEKRYGGSAMVKKWRVYANAKTNHPQRVKWHEKLSPDGEYILERITLVEYLSDSKIQAVIKDASF